jgi:hypothetical protein
VQAGAQNSVKKGAYLGPSNESERARETRVAHLSLTPVREVGMLKRHGVGEGESELGANFTSFVLP